MVKNFDELSDQSRLWIYQSNRALTAEDVSDIEEKAASFISGWAAHGQDLLASAIVMHNHFLIIAADENFNMASGCSIDSQFRFVQDLGKAMDIDFFNRLNIAFLLQDQVELIPMSAIKQNIEEGNITADSTFFDNNLQTKGDLRVKWLKNASDSWLSRYFRTQNSVI